MVRARNCVVFICLLVVAGSGSVWAQPAGTARPVKPIKVDKSSYTADESPGSIFVLFGNATVGAGVAGADPSTVNLVQMDRTLKDVEGLRVPISGYFSLGSLVANGVDDGGKSMTDRLGLLKAFYQSKVKSPLHCVVGGEVLGQAGKSDANAIEAWRQWTVASGWSAIDGKPTAMNYAYSQGKDRMVFLDTVQESGPDATWLATELERDKADKSLERVFVFGYRPLTAPGEAKLDPQTREFIVNESTLKIRKLLVTNEKVVGYFCGSPSMFNVSPLEPGAKTQQVVIGNAGGPLDPSWKASSVGYGFCVVVVYVSGRVSLIPFSRNAPTGDQPYFSADPNPPMAAVAKYEMPLWEKKPRQSN